MKMPSGILQEVNRILHGDIITMNTPIPGAVINRDKLKYPLIKTLLLKIFHLGQSFAPHTRIYDGNIPILNMVEVLSF